MASAEYGDDDDEKQTDAEDDRVEGGNEKGSMTGTHFLFPDAARASAPDPFPHST